MTKKEKTLKTKTAKNKKPQDEMEIKNIEINKTREYEKARLWMWFGVAVVGITMVLVWIIGFKLQISTYFSRKNENNSVKKMEDDWNQLFKEENEKVKIKKQINEVLNTLEEAQKQQTAIITSTASGTLFNNTSSSSTFTTTTN